jgi:hypothetical protein
MGNFKSPGTMGLAAGLHLGGNSKINIEQIEHSDSWTTHPHHYSGKMHNHNGLSRF